MIVQPRTFAEAEVRIAAGMAGIGKTYESRPQQQALAAFVEGTLSSRQHGLAEAGCGTGKSLGGMIPAILSGKRVVVSTATKALQDQYATQDVPFLQAHLGVDFTFALLKGRSNYVCLNKAATVDPGEIAGLADILAHLWANEENPGFIGERSDLPFEVSNRDWMKLAADTEDCQAFECKDTGTCFAQRARARAKLAQVVVVNHALYLTDLVVREMSGGVASLLDQHDVVLFDEAHEVESYASNALGSQFKISGVIHLTNEVRNFGRRHVPAKADALEAAGNAVAAAVNVLWDGLGKAFSAANTDRMPVTAALILDELPEEFVGLATALQGLHETVLAGDMLHTVATASQSDVRKRQQRLVRRTSSTLGRFVNAMTASFDDLVRWVERDPKGNLTFATAPVTVAPYLSEALFDRGDVTAILMSATLSVNNSFDYIAGRLGVSNFGSIDVGTPFDFAAQSLLYVPANLPDPGKERNAWSSRIVQEVASLVKASDGRALLLFTSRREMDNVHDMLAPRLPYTVLKQGDMPNQVLADTFMADPSSVLFATKSFFTGVDFHGDACSLVVIDKLPFPVPSDPIVKARQDAIERAGGNAFKEFTIPEMTLPLKQGFGRLIRSKKDRGVVAILDPRLVTKGYGKTILNSLPPAGRVGTLAEVEAFFA